MSSGSKGSPPPISMAGMPAQHQAEPHTAAQARARYFNSANAFNIELPAVPAYRFDDPAAAAMADSATYGLYPCDQSAAMACATPATTPLMLARYVRVGNDPFQTRFVGTGSLWYVISGRGQSVQNGEPLSWSAGDVLFFSGAAPIDHTSQNGDAVLWVVTDEPLLALGTLSPDSGQDALAPVHFPAAEIERQLQLLFTTQPDADTSGMALVFSCEALEQGRNILPTLTLSLNTLEAGCVQRAHRHNSAALTLIVDGPGAFSMVDGECCTWRQWSTLVTPAGAHHSHHNPAAGRARFLIVQDGALHYHARTMGFQFL
jgi:gentisate 1,2-dioxygenase